MHTHNSTFYECLLRYQMSPGVPCRRRGEKNFHRSSATKRLVGICPCRSLLMPTRNPTSSSHIPTLVRRRMFKRTQLAARLFVCYHLHEEEALASGLPWLL